MMEQTLGMDTVGGASASAGGVSAPVDGVSLSVAPFSYDALLMAFQARISVDDFEAWILPLTCGGAVGTTLTLLAPTRFIADWVVRYWAAPMAAVSGELFGGVWKVDVVVTAAKPAEKVETVLAELAPAPNPLPEAADTTPEWMKGIRLDERFTFSTFVTGKSNQFAFAAAKRIAEEPTPTFNPFFLHGGVGLGKTHLMHAIGWDILARRPGSTILYLSAEQFLYKFVRALRDHTTFSFKETLRNVDVLMIDDIQFFAGKDSSQEEFFHTFNTLVSMGKQVILTADKSPHELANIEERLKSRLGCGLTVEVHAPEVETRLAILQKKAQDMGLDLTQDVGMMLASTISSNVRELEGALNRLAAFSRLTGTPLTVDFARDQLRDLFRVNTRSVSVDDIQKQVADYFRIRVADMHSPRRNRDIARPRQIAMYLSKTMTSRSYPDIGRSFGGRDHTTVMHACEQVVNLMDKDTELAEHVKILEKMLSAR